MPWRHIGGTGVQLHSFLTSALDWAPRTLYSLLESSVSNEYKAAWAPEPVWTFSRRANSVSHAAIRTPNRPAHSSVTTPTTPSRLPAFRLGFICLSIQPTDYLFIRLLVRLYIFHLSAYVPTPTRLSTCSFVHFSVYPFCTAAIRDFNKGCAYSCFLCRSSVAAILC